MAIQIQGTTVIDDSRNLSNIANLKTVNSNNILGSGDIAVQPTLVSGTNIKTVNGGSLLGPGDLSVQAQFTLTQTAVNKTLSNLEHCEVTAAGLTITLPATPSAGWSVKIGIRGNITNTVVGRNSTNIMGLAENITIDVGYVTITLVYQNATDGWVLV